MKSGLNIEFDDRRAPRWPLNLVAAALILAGSAGGLGCGKPAPAPESAESKPVSPSPPNGMPASAQATAVPKAESKVPAAPADMVLVARGTFLMGDKDEVDAPPHEVTVGPFFIDKNLVTQEQYEKAMGDNPSRWKGEKNPVEQVRWSDAVRYCNKRSELEGLEPCYDLQTWTCRFDATGYRLPTEAEWEYACRAGTSTRYFFGDNAAKLGNHAWFDKNAGGRPRPVGQKQPNPWGLFDMSGNVWQWCNDFYQVDYYANSPKEDPRGPESGDKKVVRGGAWRFGAETCKAGYRYNESPGYADVCFGYDIYGFRCVRKAM